MSRDVVSQGSADELRVLLEQALVRQSQAPRRTPLSLAQRRLWFLEQMEPNSALYNMQHVARLRGPLEIEALQQALQAVVNRHESLRTRIALRDGEPWQVITDDVRVELPFEDLSNLSSEQREQA